MTDVTGLRENTESLPKVCKYCRASREWRDASRTNPAQSRGGSGTDLSPVPTGDDPISGIIAFLMLPIVLWELLKGLFAGIDAVIGWFTRPRPAGVAPKPAPKQPPTTPVVLTICDRHRRLRNRFLKIGAVGTLVVVGLWVWAILETRRVMGTEEVDLAVGLILGAIVASVLLLIYLGSWSTAFLSPATDEDSDRE